MNAGCEENSEPRRHEGHEEIGCVGKITAATKWLVNETTSSYIGSVPRVTHPSDPTTSAIIGAAIEVHRVIGPGVLESTYQKCLCRELSLRGIAFESGLVLPLEYKGAKLGQGYVIDLLVNNQVVVELKCVAKLLPIHECQLITYMRLRSLSAGLLINFKVPLLKDGIKRILL